LWQNKWEIKNLSYFPDFFQMHGYFGASEDQISIFEQRTIPAFDSQVTAIEKMAVVFFYFEL
jgi:hypothetical protein